MNETGDTPIRLGHSGGPPANRAVVAVILLAFLAAVLPGGLGLRGSPGGFGELLAWALLVTGVLVVLVGGVVLAVGRRYGRAAELTPDGVRLPGRRTLIPWSSVQRCDVRDAGGRRLIAAWLAPPSEGDRSGEPVWLGDIARASIPEEDLLAMVQRWMERS